MLICSAAPAQQHMTGRRLKQNQQREHAGAGTTPTTHATTMGVASCCDAIEKHECNAYARQREAAASGHSEPTPNPPDGKHQKVHRTLAHTARPEACMLRWRCDPHMHHTRTGATNASG